MAERTYIEPNPSAETSPFWDAAREGRLLVKRCTACGKAHWYPRTVCPFCSSRDTEWIAASGEGTVYACTRMRRADPPYVMAYVTLAEGPTMMTNLVGCGEVLPKVGDPVTVSFVETPGGFHLPMFRPKDAT
jgi:uncharacterized OB-fold protein